MVLMPHLACQFAQHPVLALIAIWFSNPFIPDFGSQFIVATVIGLLLPSIIIDPIYNALHRISLIKKFEDVLSKHKYVKKIIKSKNERVRTIIPRIISGYVVTYSIAYMLLLYLCISFA